MRIKHVSLGTPQPSTNCIRTYDDALRYVWYDTIAQVQVHMGFLDHIRVRSVVAITLC